jgi:hypothetical protein
MYYDFKAGNKEYKLRLSTRAIVALEKTIGCNPLMIFGNGDTVPTITVMVAILHASLQQMNHGITLNDAYDIFDEYLADGNAPTDFIQVILDIYQVSGLIPREAETEKN